MLNIKILGAGCPNCHKVEANARAALDALQPTGGFEIVKITDPLDISAYVLKTPGLVINEKVVSAGRIPDADEIKTWLANAE